jgi:hypothetical protein
LPYGQGAFGELPSQTARKGRGIDLSVSGRDGSGGSKMSLVQFAQTIPEKFNVHGIEPWSHHFESTESNYIRGLNASFKAAGLRVVDIPCDVRVQLCSGTEERTAGLNLHDKWVEVAILLGSPSIRVQCPARSVSR